MIWTIHRNYIRFTVTGTEKSENGNGRSWKETGICLEDEDPLKIAMKRNQDIAKCSRFKIEKERAFRRHVTFEHGEEDRKRLREETKSYGYVNMTNKWDEYDIRW